METSAPPAPAVDSPRRPGTWYPRQVSAGWWETRHVQGIAVDRRLGHVYFSFTTLLVKTDLAGRLLGTVDGFSGHLGDVTFDAHSRRLYASLEYKEAEAFYVAMFDVDAIDRVGLSAEDPAVVRTVHLAEVVRDFTGHPEAAQTIDRAAAALSSRYGCSGIDGIAVGPAFGRTDGPGLLTVAYGVYSDLHRGDNDHQVLLQYSTDGWWDVLGRPLVEADLHRNGPRRPAGKYFIRTGNTTFGVQNLEYDAFTARWLLGVYPGGKPGFPNFTLFAVDASARPRRTALAGLGGERGSLIPLAEDGHRDPATGIRGWYQQADVGIASLGDGLFYLSTADAAAGLQTSTLTLCRWTGDEARPLVPIGAAEPAQLRSHLHGDGVQTGRAVGEDPTNGVVLEPAV